MELAHDVDTVSHHRAYLAKWLRAGLDLLRRDVVSARRRCERIERPDLHRGDAHIKKRLRELRRSSREGDLVLVRPGSRLIAASGRHQTSAGPSLVVGVTGTGVVDTDLFTR